MKYKYWLYGYKYKYWLKFFVLILKSTIDISIEFSIIWNDYCEYLISIWKKFLL